MSGDKIKNKEDNTSGRAHKGASLEMYFSTKSTYMTAIKIEDIGEICGDNSSEEEIVGKRAKKRRREYKGDETEEDDFHITVDGQQSDGANNFERVTVQKDKCTVIIGWKGWYAFESEEDEKNMKALDNKRSQRRMFERACCQVQNTSAISGPVSGSREVVESGEIEALPDKTPRRPLLEDGELGSSMPLDPSIESYSVTCNSTMLGHTERAQNPSSFYAVEKESPGEPSSSTIACEDSSVVVPSCQETLASVSVKQTSLIHSGDCTIERFANIKESKTANLDKDGHKMLVMEARSGKALQVDDMGVEIGEGVGGKIKRKGRSKRLRKDETILIERGKCPTPHLVL